MNKSKNFTINGKISIDENHVHQKVLHHSQRRLTSKDLPKSIRFPLDTHSAISTISNIEN